MALASTTLSLLWKGRNRLYGLLFRLQRDTEMQKEMNVHLNCQPRENVFCYVGITREKNWLESFAKTWNCQSGKSAFSKLCTTWRHWSKRSTEKPRCLQWRTKDIAWTGPRRLLAAATQISANLFSQMRKSFISTGQMVYSTSSTIWEKTEKWFPSVRKMEG